MSYEIILATINSGNVQRISRHQITTERGISRLQGEHDQVWMTRETAIALGVRVETFWGEFASGRRVQIKTLDVMETA